MVVAVVVNEGRVVGARVDSAGPASTTKWRGEERSRAERVAGDRRGQRWCLLRGKPEADWDGSWTTSSAGEQSEFGRGQKLGQWQGAKNMRARNGRAARDSEWRRADSQQPAASRNARGLV
jgi:hypothetical protein